MRIRTIGNNRAYQEQADSHKERRLCLSLKMWIRTIGNEGRAFLPKWFALSGMRIRTIRNAGSHYQESGFALSGMLAKNLVLWVNVLGRIFVGLTILTESKLH